MKRIIFITGSTDGIGKLAAIQLAGDGHRLCVHGRSAEKLAKVVAEIKQESDNENVNGFVADLSDLTATRQMARQVKAELPKIDVLINNAGVYSSRNSVNAQGFDLRFAVNYLAPYVLTKELLPLLQKGKGPRLINLSSAAQAPVSTAGLSGKKRLPEQEAYAQSKLALTMWSFYLAQKYPDVSVIAVNPGSLLNTKMVREAFGIHWSPAGKGADILYDLAVSVDYRGITGKYFDNDRDTFGQAHPDAYDQQKVDQLIDMTEQLLADR